MKVAPVIYLILSVLGVGTVILVPLNIYRAGSTALPIWRAAASPGELSAAHGFLSSQCEACHTPDRGIVGASCISCHTPDAAVLAMQPTAFHAAIQDCRGCHVVHRGSMVRPTEMDHAVLARIGWQRALKGSAAASLQTDTTAMPEIRHWLAGITGEHPANDIQALDCFACHSNQNPHRGGTSVGCCGRGSANSVDSLFGRECADCHVTTTWKIAGYKHPSPRSEDCAECHQAPPCHYYMGHFEMVVQAVAGQPHAQVEQCYLCHQTDAWNDIKGVGWYKAH